MGDIIPGLVPVPPGPSWSRVQSKSCAVVDRIAVVVGVALYLVAAVDSLASWPSNHVLISDTDLSRAAFFVLMPSWAWLIISAAKWSSDRRQGAARPMPPFPSGPLRTWFVAAAVVAVVVIAGGFEVGAAKGAVRVLPGPRYQVSTGGVNDYAWTTVPLAQFRAWQASFVREDAFFMLFGLLLAGACAYLLVLHRDAVRGNQDDQE